MTEAPLTPLQGPSIVLAVAEPAAQKHRAAVAETTSGPHKAYTEFSLRKCGYEEGWLLP